jgi:hypothetical protein
MAFNMAAELRKLVAWHILHDSAKRESWQTCLQLQKGSSKVNTAWTCPWEIMAPTSWAPPEESFDTVFIGTSPKARNTLPVSEVRRAK